MRFWLTLSAALLLPAVANAAEHGKLDRLELQIEKLNARLQKLQSELLIARGGDDGATSAAPTAAQVPANTKPKARLNPALVRMQAIPKDDPSATAETAKPLTVAAAHVIAKVTLPAVTVSPLPAFASPEDVEVAVDMAQTAGAVQADDFDPETGEEPLIRLDPDTGRPIRPAPTPKAEPVEPKPACKDKTCAKSLRDDRSATTRGTDTPSTRTRGSRISWR